MPLFEIDAQLEDFERLITDAGGVIDDETEAQLDALIDQRDDMWEAYQRVYYNNAAQAATYAEQAKRLAALAKTHETTANRAKCRLLASMQANGIDKLTTDIGKASVRKGRASVGLTVDVLDLPVRFQFVPGRPYLVIY